MADGNHVQTRSEDEVRREISERQRSIKDREERMKQILNTSDPAWQELHSRNDTDRKIIAVLYWVLGEDLLWE